MSPGRKLITADHVNGLHLDKDANVLSAMATDGPCNIGGRGVQVFISDDVIRGLLAHLATDRRWSAAFDAVQADREARIAEAAGSRRITPDQLRSRARLIEAMQSAMAARDLAWHGELTQASARQRILQAASRPDATDEEAERAVDLVQGTRTRIRSYRSERSGHYTDDELAAIRAELNAAGIERAADGSFLLPETRVPVHRLNLPAAPPLEDDEQYAALVSYGSAIVAAERGEETELVRPGGQVAARIVPA